MTPDIAALRIGRSINTVENELDELVAKTSELLAEIARARVATGEAAALLHAPMSRVTKLQQNLMDARLEVVRAHRELNRVAETMDIPWRCPEEATHSAESEVASLVAA